MSTETRIRQGQQVVLPVPAGKKSATTRVGEVLFVEGAFARVVIRTTTKDSTRVTYETHRVEDLRDYAQWTLDEKSRKRVDQRDEQLDRVSDVTVYVTSKSQARCRGARCGQAITFYRTLGGRTMPFTGDPPLLRRWREAATGPLLGAIDAQFAHHRTCPDVDVFRRSHHR